MFSKMFERFLPFLEADDGTNIAGAEDGDLADLQDDEDLDDDAGAEDSDPADQKDMSFKDDPRNKEFAEQRRKEALEAERQKNALLAKDYDIAKKYGAEYGVFSEQDIAAKYGQSHGITTLEQFETALMNQQYKQAGIDPNLINQIVSSHPTLKKAEALIQQMGEQQANSNIMSEFEELKKQFPESGLKTLADLGKLPTYKAIEEKFARGYSLADAYESANRAEIRTKQQAAAKQKTLNDINSKSHLNTEGDGEGETNDVHIPAETLQMYLDMGMSKKDAMKHHKKLYG
jgi:hypothetical protein